MPWIAYELELYQWILLGLAAFFVGISKTGLPGVGILVVPLAANFLPARQSVGIVLPMLLMADLFGAVWYRRDAQWSHLLRLLPSTFAGIGAGWLVLRNIENELLAPLIGLIVLVMLSVKAWLMMQKEERVSLSIETSRGRLFAFFIGFFAGLTTTMANAAGPVMILYLLAMRLPKNHFVGTAAWFFFTVNSIKFPLYFSIGLINAASLRLDLLMFPIVALGAVTGILILPRIPQKLFNIVALALAAAAALLLIFRS